MKRKQILPPWLLWLALAIGAILGLVAGIGRKPTPSLEKQAIEELNWRRI